MAGTAGAASGPRNRKGFALSLLTIISGVTGAAIRCGIASPATVIGNVDTNTQKLLGLAQDIGLELAERGDWRNLDMAGTVTGDAATTLWPLPSDFMRLCSGQDSPVGPFISSLRPYSPLFGPVNDENLNQMKAFPAATILPVWRFIGSNIEIWPALALAEVVTYHYYSKAWIKPVAGANQTAWALDTDASLINEDTIMKGVVYSWKASQGFDYAEDMRRFELSFERNSGQQGTERIISTSHRSSGDSDHAWQGTISYTGP
jgi:hypothetical protein